MAFGADDYFNVRDAQRLFSAAKQQKSSLDIALGAAASDTVTITGPGRLETLHIRANHKSGALFLDMNDGTSATQPEAIPILTGTGATRPTFETLNEIGGESPLLKLTEYDVANSIFSMILKQPVSFKSSGRFGTQNLHSSSIEISYKAVYVQYQT